MTENMSVERILDEVRSVPSVYEATVVSRSGMHIAGDTPRGVHLETFVAMSAILLGAAETATSELKDRLQFVSVELNRSKMILLSAGNRALLVITSSDDVPTDELAKSMSKYADMIASQI